MSSHADYVREFRRNNPDLYQQQLRGQRAYRRALMALRYRHRDEFDEILTVERAAVGLPAVGVLRPGPRRKDGTEAA